MSEPNHSNPTNQGDTASFGFQEVPEGEKAGRVRAVFDSVAKNYDLMNDLMSAGLHRVWKDIAVNRLNPQPGETILDIAGGTGDIARRLKKRADGAQKRRGLPVSARVIISDINVDMLEAGRKRGEDGLEWVAADAERLPFEAGMADAYICAFGIRNMTHIDQALSEAHRVLRPGGRFFCLEFSRLAIVGLEKIYEAYSFNVIPVIGEMVAKDRESYRYLVESIRRFPDQETFKSMIGAAGFRRAGYQNLTGGVAALHFGFVD
jgi:demethylmenaquinone methyltransferase/2-methoxy-6-polyprenyl-1,4-benzoquinol methylase